MDTQATNLGGSLVLRGVLAILFGAAAVFWPGLTLVTLVYLFSAFVLVNGVVDLIYGIGRAASVSFSSMSRVLTLLFGALQIGVGVYLLRHPRVSFATLILLIGFTLIVRGVFEIVAGLFEEGSALFKSVMVIGGVIAAIAGVVILFQPVAGGVAFVWVLGVYALITGPMLIALALDINKVEQAARIR
jgi:uncharacterized membrane protein HdeD (DUF308 family)